MSESMRNADRNTHLKIVSLALVAATMVAGVGISARVVSDDAPAVRSAQVQKAGQPVVWSANDQQVVR